MEPTKLRHISKQEEEEALNVIRRKWVPIFVERWNKVHRIHKVSEENILKTLRKVRHDSKQVPNDVKKYNRSDIIHYQAPLSGPNKYVTFMVRRYTMWAKISTPYKDGTLMAGYFSGPCLFEEPVYENKKDIFLTENTEQIILTKEDEERAVSFIGNLTDRKGVRLGKTLTKVMVLPSENPPCLSKAVYYDAKTSDGLTNRFKIFRSPRRGGLCVNDYFQYKIHNIDV